MEPSQEPGPLEVCPQLQLLRQPNTVLLALEASLESPGHSQEVAVPGAWESVANPPSLTEGP